ncbi:MAG TPA: EAL domain-containing protein, partial [Desulfobacteria bacterium]|nr:EAL domain-containing protein [Desulfobacteria bacterium]
VTFAGKINSSLIAEGIETELELNTIKSLGITFGQGYLLGRPQSEPPWPQVFQIKKSSITNSSNRDMAQIINVVPRLQKKH